MSNKAKGYALRQPDYHRRPKRRLPKVQPGEPDGGNGGDTDGVGALVWVALIALVFIVIRLIVK